MKVQSLINKVAVVTASTKVSILFKLIKFFKGIGYAIARRLGLEGAAVVVSSRKTDHVKVFKRLKYYIIFFLESSRIIKT